MPAGPSDASTPTSSSSSSRFKIPTPESQVLSRGAVYGGFHGGGFEEEADYMSENLEIIRRLRMLNLNDEQINFLMRGAATEPEKTLLQQPGFTPKPIRLGMYVNPGPGADASLSGGASVTRNSGFGATDSNGLIAPGTLAPSFRDVASGGGIRAPSTRAAGFHIIKVSSSGGSSVTPETT
jgi:hypothetical protein